MIKVRVFGHSERRWERAHLELNASQAGTVNELLTVSKQMTGAANRSELRKASIS